MQSGRIATTPAIATRCFCPPERRFGDADILRPEAHVLLDDRGDDLIVRILKDHAGFLPDLPDIFLALRVHPVDPHRPLRGEEQRVHVLCEGRFSGSVVAEDRDDRALLHIDVDSVDCPDLLIVLLVFRVFYIIESKFYGLDNSHNMSPFCSSEASGSGRKLPMIVQISSRPSFVSAENATTFVPFFTSRPSRITFRAF